MDWIAGLMHADVIISLQHFLYSNEPGLRQDKEFLLEYAEDLDSRYQRYSPRNIIHLQRAIILYEKGWSPQLSIPVLFALYSNLGNCYYQRAGTHNPGSRDIQDSKIQHERALELAVYLDDDRKSGALNNIARHCSTSIHTRSLC